MQLKPYLQLKDRLTQIWINKNTIILILMAVKLIIFSKSLQSSLQMAKYYTLNSCPTIDTVASNVVSIPHYLSKSANYMIKKSVEEINEKTVDTLDLMLTGVENLIIFALEVVIGTYACVLVSTIDGAVDVAVNATESIVTWVNDTLGDITSEIEDGLEDLSTVINSVISAAESVVDLFTDDENDTTTTFNQVNLTVSALKNLQIPSSINDKLEELKANTPDFDTVKNKTEQLISEPFDYVKKQIANVSVLSTDADDELYVPSLQNLQICSDNSDKIEEFYQDLSDIVRKTMLILVMLLIVGALLVLVPVVYSEIRRWRKLQNLDSKLNPYQQQMSQNDPIEVFEETYNRYPTQMGVLASKIVTKRNINDDEESKVSKQTSIRWFMSYIFSSRASIVLGLSLAGFIVVIAQFILLSVLENAISQQDTPFDDISSQLTSRVSESITNWTTSTNEYLTKQEDDINDDLFSWIRTTTDAVNDTVSAFVDEMNSAIADAFNGTILYSPVKAIVGCVIEDKLIKIEQGLTWVHDNAEISLPRVTEEYLSLAFEDSNSTTTTSNSTSSSSNSTDISQSALVSKANSLMSEAETLMTSVLKMTMKQYRKGLMVEVWISTALFIVWLFQLFIGFIIAYYGSTATTASTSDIYDEKINNNYYLNNISEPRPLTREEQKIYGFPYSDPFQSTPTLNDQALHGEGPFADSNKLDSPMVGNWYGKSAETVMQQDQQGQLYRHRQSSYYSTVRGVSDQYHPTDNDEEEEELGDSYDGRRSPRKIV